MMGKPVGTELFWVVAGQGMAFLLNIVTLKVLTSQLGAVEYGRFVLGLSIAGGLGLIFYGPLSQAVSRYVHVCSEAGQQHVLPLLRAAYLRRLALAAALLAVVLVLVLALLSLPEWVALTVVALGYGAATGALLVYVAELNTRRQRRICSLLQSVEVLLRLLVAILLVSWVGRSALWALAGFMMASLAVGWWARSVVNKHTEGLLASRPATVDAVIPGFFRYTASFSLFAIPAMFSLYGDRWLVQQMLTQSDVGIYVALNQIAAAPANLLLAIFSQLLHPILFQRAGGGQALASVHASRMLLYRALSVLVFVLFGIVAVSALFGEWLTGWLTSTEFARHGGLLWQLALAAGIFQIGQALAAETFVHNRPFLLFFPKMAHAVSFLGLAYLWILPRGLEGVALAAVVAALIYLLLVAVTNAWMVARPASGSVP